jgi:hypothetical protein
VTELRALEATINGDRWPANYAGYFDDSCELLAALDKLNTAKGIYFIPNPVDPALIARANNRIRKAVKGESTSDDNIMARHWLLIDCDAVRPAGISASNEQHKAALERAKAIADELHQNFGWPDPIVADSGNGGHLVYRIDEPADDGGLVDKCLKVLAAKFNDRVVKVDSSVHNQARIWKLYGTRACKGDSTSDRPHRMSRILSVPSILDIVSHDHLVTLANEAPIEAKRYETNGHAAGRTFDIDAFISRHGFDVSGPEPYKGGRCWIFNQSPMCEHHGDGPFLIQLASGAVTAGCHHDSCHWNWHDLRARYEPKQQPKGMPAWRSAENIGDPPEPFQKFTLATLRRAYPKLNRPIVDGLFRQGETVNIIADPKRGKSWFGYGLALSIITGQVWLGRFPTSAGRVLLIDNELHCSTLAHRIPVVADAMELPYADFQDDLDVWPLRGRLRSLVDLDTDFAPVEPGTYKVILMDAMYRFAINGVSENDNAAMAMFYNQLDRIAERTKAAIVLIHHSSKGSQSDKRITDVGAGAGAQSRAADCHLVLREHEQAGIVVLEAAVRSFPPVEPLALRWEFPLWVPESNCDPRKLKGKLSAKEQRQNDRDMEGIEKIMKALAESRATARHLRAKTGLSKDRQQRLLDCMTSQGQATATETTIRGNVCLEYRLAD